MTTYSAVVARGIYCRPGCAARPLARNVRTFDLAAAAEARGFRGCRRCRPYRVAGPVGYSAPEIVCEAVQLIIDGALDDGGTEAALADRIGMSPRHLRRLFLKHLGASPDQLARSRRAPFAPRPLRPHPPVFPRRPAPPRVGALLQSPRPPPTALPPPPPPPPHP